MYNGSSIKFKLIDKEHYKRINRPSFCDWIEHNSSAICQHHLVKAFLIKVEVVHQMTERLGHNIKQWLFPVNSTPSYCKQRMLKKPFVFNYKLIKLVLRRTLLLLQHPYSHSNQIVLHIRKPINCFRVTHKFQTVGLRHLVCDGIHSLVLVLPIALDEEIVVFY